MSISFSFDRSDKCVPRPPFMVGGSFVVCAGEGERSAKYIVAVLDAELALQVARDKTAHDNILALTDMAYNDWLLQKGETRE